MTSPAASAPAGGRSRRLWIAAVLLAELACLSLWVRSGVTRAGNETSRLATVQALVEQGTFAIDGASVETVDKVLLDGRFYSNKPPLLSLWLAGWYAPLHWGLGLTFAEHLPLVVHVLTLLGISSFSVLLTYLFVRRLLARGVGLGMALGLGVAVVLSTWIASYAPSINNHTVAATLLFALVWTLEGCEAGPNLRRALLAGLLAGMVLAVEIPAGGAFFLVGLAVIFRAGGGQRRRSLLAYLGGFIAVTLGMVLVNLFAHGHPVDVYWLPDALRYQGSVLPATLGGLRRPENPLSYLFHITFGWRGLFSHMPALLLAVPYLVRHRRGLGAAERWSLAGLGLLLVFYCTRTGDFGGWSYGFRFLVCAIPLLFWWAALGWLELSSRRRLAWAALLLPIGLLTAWVGAQNPWPVAYEGASTVPESVEWRVRSPLASGLLVWSYQHAPEGRLFRWLSEEVYDLPTSARYLRKELINRGEEESLPELDRRVEGWKQRFQPLRPPP